MCSVYKPHKEGMLDQNTLPLYLACDLKKVYIIAMTGHYRVNHFFNFLEQKIINKNIVYKLAKQGSQGLYNRHDRSL